MASKKRMMCLTSVTISTKMATNRKLVMHGHGDTGIQALNTENEAARFNELLNGYFRTSTATGKRRRGRGGRHMPSQPTENDLETTPGVCLKQLKRLLRDTEASVQSQHIQRLYAMILHQLRRVKTSPILLSRAVNLCREIFKRSVAFRTLIATQTASFFDQLLVAAGEDPSANVSRALRARSRGSKQLTTVLELVETWKQDFGERYPSLVAGHGVLVERGYEFPHERERRQEEREREVNTRQHRERVNDAKMQQRDREMKRYVPEMEQVLVEMNRVFEILVPTLDAFHVEEEVEDDVEASLPDPKFGALNAAAHEDENSDKGQNDKPDDTMVIEGDGEEDDDDVQWAPPATGVNAEDDEEGEDVEWEAVAAESVSTHNSVVDDNGDDEDTVRDEMDINDIVQAYGLGSSSYQLTIEVSKQVCEESSENDALFRSLADGALRIRKRFLPLLDDWEQHSTLTGQSLPSSSTLQSQREVLHRIRDLRDRMTRALLKWDDLVQGSKEPKRVESTRTAVVSLPLDAYNLPTKRKRGRVQP